MSEYGAERGVWRKAVVTLIRLALIAVAVYIISRAVHWDDVIQVQSGATVLVPGIRSTLVHARWPCLGLGFGLYLSGLAVIGVRWSEILAMLGYRLGAVRASLLLVASMTVGLVLPGSVGGDLYRITAVATRGTGAVIAAASVVIDRAIGVWTLVLLAGVVAVVLGGVGPGGLHVLLLTAGLALIPGALLFGRIVGAVPASIRARIPKSVTEAASLTWNAPRERLLRVVALSALNTAAQVSAVLALVTCYWHLPTLLGSAIVAIALGLIASALPIMPQGIGVGEAAFVALLGLARVPAGAVLAAVLTFRVFVYAVALGGSPLLLLRIAVPVPPEKGSAIWAPERLHDHEADTAGADHGDADPGSKENPN